MVMMSSVWVGGDLGGMYPTAGSLHPSATHVNSVVLVSARGAVSRREGCTWDTRVWYSKFDVNQRSRNAGCRQ